MELFKEENNTISNKKNSNQLYFITVSNIVSRKINLSFLVNDKLAMCWSSGHPDTDQTIFITISIICLGNNLSFAVNDKLAIC